jgi:Asp-tRNA(Asn)/Glu-tRNA(Gln) amidotransferase C subunit
MAWSKEERVRELARLVGIVIAPEEETEVADRFESLMKELDHLVSLDLANIEPVTIFPEEPGDDDSRTALSVRGRHGAGDCD